MKKLINKILAPYRKRKLQKQLTNLYNLTLKIDILLNKLGMGRNEKKAFWENFVKHSEFRQDIFEKLFVEIYQTIV